MPIQIFTQDITEGPWDSQFLGNLALTSVNPEMGKYHRKLPSQSEPTILDLKTLQPKKHYIFVVLHLGMIIHGVTNSKNQTLAHGQMLITVQMTAEQLLSEKNVLTGKP